MGVGVVFSARPVFAAILCLCLFLGATAILPAGASDTANLPALLKKLDTLPEAEKIPVLNLIAETYLARKDTREALRWAEQALRLALVRGNDWEIVRARLTLGSAYYFLENYALSLEHLKECSTKLKELEGAPGGVPRDKLLKARIETAGWLGYAFEKNQDIQSSLDALQTGVDLAKEAGDERSTADFLYRIAAGRFVKTEYEKALAAGIEAVETARKLRDPGLLSDCESAVGFIYRDLKRWDTALEFFQSALRSSEAAHDERRTALVLNEIGNIFTSREDTKEALRYKEKALDAAKRSNDDYTLSCCLHDIGSVYLEQGDKAAALIFLRQALDIDIKEGQEREIAIVSQNIAEIYMSLNRIGEAQAVLERALPYIERVNFPKERAAIYGLLADVHERRGEPGLALAYLRKASDLEERVPKEEGSRQPQELQTRYETDKKRRENETLAQKNNFNELTLKKQTAIRYSLIALSLLVILIAALIYNRYRLKARANWELKLANAEISAKKDELDRANVRLEELSRHDPLTGLSNRRDMMEKFEEEKIRFDRTGRPFALIMADIDSFKDINDGHGHDCGDFVLKRLAGVLRSSLRKLTWISRWGGDEFLLLLPETNLAGARRVTDKIRDRMARTPFSWDGQALDVRLSLGVSVFREGTEIDDLLREADQDMYRKKKAAKARPVGLQA
jgi:diguanylate cyclase (GGDEF)-like protein